MNKKISVRVLAEIAIFAALGFALDALEGGIFKGVFVNGGGIGFAMVPVFIIAYRRGLIPGIVCGLILSVIQMLGGVYVISSASYTGAMKFFAPFFQIALDYVLGYTVVGFAGAFASKYRNSTEMSRKLLWIVIGTVIGGLAKFTCHVLSGGFFWLDPSIEFMGVNGGSWIYTFVYNGAYCIPNILICTAIMVLIARFYPIFLNPEEKEVAKEEDIDKDTLLVAKAETTENNKSHEEAK
jgi:thiamine transporter